MRPQQFRLRSGVQEVSALLEANVLLTGSEEAGLTVLTWTLVAKLHAWKQRVHPSKSTCYDQALPEHAE
jgi:hypothetical protein